MALCVLIEPCGHRAGGRGFALPRGRSTPCDMVTFERGTAWRCVYKNTLRVGSGGLRLELYFVVVRRLQFLCGAFSHTHPLNQVLP